jgi:serine phosphatase RsbU (regulator of sigma subunit)
MLNDFKSEINGMLNNGVSDTVVNMLNKYAYKFRYSNPNATIYAAQNALDISKILNYNHGANTAKMNLAFGNFILSKEYPILKELTEVYQYFKATKSIPEYPITLNYLGNIYDNYGDYQKGLSLCHEALKYAQEFDLKEVESDILSTIGLIMNRISDFSGAIQSFKNSYEIRMELNNLPAMASSLNLLARTYALNNQFELSEQYYRQAIALRLEINETGALPWSYIGLASLYEKKMEYENAMLFYNKSLELNKITPDKRCSLHCYIGLSRIFLETRNFQDAKEYIEMALQIAQELSANALLYEAYEILSKYYEKLSDFREAYTNFKKFHLIKESVLNSQTHSMLKNQQLSFEIEKVQKDAEIHQLRNIELKNAYAALENRTNEILDSIEYAKNIQNALLPPVDFFHSFLPESFIYYNPKDILSGDFYWCQSIGKRIYVAAADCTGHGVPGSLMSILGMSLLNEIVNSCKEFTVDEILNELRSRIITSLRQSIAGTSLKDGIDIAACIIDTDHNYLEFAGAFNPLYIVNENKLTEIKGDRMPIGIFNSTDQPFTKHSIPIKKGMCIYMFSDGFIDQFGGPEGKKYKAKNFRELILKLAPEPMNVQKVKLDQALADWLQSNELIDDVLVMGIRF